MIAGMVATSSLLAEASLDSWHGEETEESDGAGGLGDELKQTILYEPGGNDGDRLDRKRPLRVVQIT